ncbi:DUF397 domain-containing protein [Streptomyces sp. NPDC091281]|uniref:DUF397 domain-containing protein n=1 Tax=Streptomyces sp. NPDC091281 TaxID=3365985 RepID=UPI00380A7DCF
MRESSTAGVAELVWFKSSYSDGTDGESCVELALTWFKSTYSGGTDGESCVELALAPGTVHVRDSKQVAGSRLVLTPDAWASFVAHASER